MKTIIHVNGHIIRSNRKAGERLPPLTVKTYKENRRCSTARIRDREGNVIAEVGCHPDKPLSCGAEVWIETELLVECL